VADAAGGFQRAGLGRPGDAHAEGCAVTERLFQPVAEVGVVDDELAEAGGAQALDVPHDEGLAAHRQQRLGGVVGERAHALAAAGGEDHRFGHGGSGGKERGTAAKAAAWGGAPRMVSRRSAQNV
jgi:hypothetical protein